MTWDRVAGWIDNPIFMKHIRSRLRPQAFATSLAVVLILCLCIAYGGYHWDVFKTGGVAGSLLALQAIILVILGAGQVGAAVNGARASGILDFHRVSPLTPTEMTLGFFFGAPIREYLQFAATLPFLALCVMAEAPSLRGLVQLMILLIALAWTFQGLAMFGALVSKVKNPSGSMVGVFVFIFFIGGYLFLGGVSSVNAVEGDRRLSFYGLSLPWVPVVLIYQVPFLFYIFLAARRKMESARLHPLSKLQAIAAMLTFAALILGGIWRQEAHEVLEVVALYLLVVPAILLTILVTPTQAEDYKGLWRARKQGRSRLPWWDDLAVNWPFLVIVAAIVLAAGTLAGSAARGSETVIGTGRPMGSFRLALATGVLTVAYFGLALQFFLLRFAGRGKMYFGLFLFLVWLLPLVAGAIQSFSWRPGRQETSGALAFALSPLAGIAMTATVDEPALRTVVQAAAITPALLFTFVFNSLLIAARRRLLKAVYLAGVARQPPAEGSDAAEPAREGPIEAE
jgi:hypothetical protein